MTKPRVGSGLLIAAFYGGLTLVLLLVISGALRVMLPGALTAKIAYNSEAYFFALVVAAWIHLRILAPDVARRRSVTGAACVGLLALGGLLLLSDLPGRIVTLNEAAFAAAIMVLYVALPRPMPLIVPWATFGLVVVGAGVAVAVGGDSWVINQAEGLGFIALLPLALDVVDRGILEPDATTRPVMRYGFYALLLGEPVLVSVLGTDLRQGGGRLALALEFLGRIHESFFGVLLICLFFAVALGRTGRAGSQQE